MRFTNLIKFIVDCMYYALYGPRVYYYEIYILYILLVARSRCVSCATILRRIKKTACDVFKRYYSPILLYYNV